MTTRRFLLKYPKVRRTHEAVQFSDGSIAVRFPPWQPEHGCISTFENMHQFKRRFGTGIIIWIDEEDENFDTGEQVNLKVN